MMRSIKQATLTALALTLFFSIQGFAQEPPSQRSSLASYDSEVDFNQTGYRASITWSQPPSSAPEANRGDFTLRFWKQNEGDSSGPYVTPPGTLGVKLWMPGMGHGSSPLTITPVVDQAGIPTPGVYLIGNVYFVMGGTWELKISFKNGTQILDQASLRLDI